MALLIDRKVVFNMRIRTPSAPQADELGMLKAVRSSSPREMGLGRGGNRMRRRAGAVRIACWSSFDFEFRLRYEGQRTRKMS